MVDRKIDRKTKPRRPGKRSGTVRQPVARPPCQAACPAGVDIPRYIRLVGEGKLSEALSIILENLPFPSICGRVCPRPCETMCNLQMLDGPVMVNALKRFIADHAAIRETAPAKSTGRRVAVVGSGPAGMTAAYYLAKLGHSVTIFEAAPRAGGLLRTGIPRYHLPDSILDQEIERLLQLGVEFQLNTRIQKLNGIFQMGYDAIFLGIGLAQGRVLPIPGKELEGVLDGLSFLRGVNLGQKVEPGGRVLVLGGGGVACDVARTALRLGASEVTAACLESRESMPALPWEIEEAEREGVAIHPLRNFLRLVGTNNHVTGVECLKLNWMKFDETGGLLFDAVKGSEHVLKADTVIFAIGQAPDLGIISDNPKIRVTRKGTIVVDPETLATGCPQVFAGGDIVGGRTVVEAVAAGRKAALAIDKELGGSGLIETASVPEVAVSLPASLPVGERAVMPSASVAERRSSFTEVELGLSEELAREQAKRCLRCDLPITIKAEKCTGCRICQFRCSFSHELVFNLSRSRIKVKRLVGAENEYDVSFTAQCDNCGICVRYCPYGALARGQGQQEV